MIRFASQRQRKNWQKVYLASCLANQRFSRIAEADGLPVGVILGKTSRTTIVHSSIPNAPDPRSHPTSHDERGKAVSQILSGNRWGGSKAFWNNVISLYKGEVALFALSRNIVDWDLESNCFTVCFSIYGSKGVPSFYLFTDTSCNLDSMNTKE